MTDSNLDNWFLWRQKTERKIKPWQREFLEAEFLISEIRRIKAANNWFKTFTRAPKHTSMGLVELYALPTKWNNKIEVSEGQYILALSALRNSLQCPVVAIFDYNTQKPRDYQYIRIIKSKVDYVLSGNGEPIKVLVVEDYDKLDDLSIYQLETPRPGVLKQFFKDNFIATTPYPDAFESTLLSSPPIHKVGGGISLASEFEERGNADKVCSSLQYVLPPELRGISAPPSVFKGTWEELAPDVEGKVAERVLGVTSKLLSKVDPSINQLVKFSKRRDSYNGELSIAGGLYHGPLENVDDASRLVSSFFDFDVSLHALDDILDYSPKPKKMLENVDEELWFNIVKQREYAPSTNDVENRIIKESKTFSKWLSGDFKERSRYAYLISTRLHDGRIEDIIRRESQSIARSNYSSVVRDDDIEKAVYNLQKRVDIGFNEEVKEMLEEQLPIGRGKFKLRELKLLSIKGQLRIQPCDIEELWGKLKSDMLIENVDELNELIDYLRKRGEIFTGSDGKYRNV